MVRGSTVLLCLVVFACLLASPLFADRSTEDLQSRVIERFDAASSGPDANSKYEYPQNHKWIVRGSKFLTQSAFSFGWIKTWPEALFPDATADQGLSALGVKAAFDRLGYNYLEFVPVEDKAGADGKPVETSIPLPGRVKLLDFWAWGSNLKYYLEIQVKDYRGMIHTLRAGDLTYVGWKNLKVEIPASIPQDVSHTPHRKGLSLVKIVLWTYPDEIVIPFTFYIDQIKVLSDMFETPFDGSDLTEAAKAEEAWKAGKDIFAPASANGGK